MRTKLFLFPILFSGLMLLGACLPGDQPAEPTAAQKDVPAPTDPAPTDPPPSATPVPPSPTPVPPTATEVQPTSTEVPPTEPPTPLPDPISVNEEVQAADGCTQVALGPASWAPIYSAYNGGSDPFFHFHTNEADFFFGVELYTVYGSGYTGGTGMFDANCTTHGICIYLVPDASNGFAYLASAGELDIKALEQVDGVLQEPVDINIRNLTLDPVPGSGSPGCFHVDEVEIGLETD